MTYDRELLLWGAKRNAVLQLWEVQRYGTDSCADADYVSIYGLRPAEWYAKGIRLLGRTAVDCTRDQLASAIGADIALTAGALSRDEGALVIDPFAGSGNTLHWILRHLPGARGIGFELDFGVFELTRRNLSTLGLEIDVQLIDYSPGLSSVTTAPDQLVIAFLAPPWGDGFGESGLDLRRTSPPLGDIVDSVIDRFGDRLLCAIQVYERVEPESLAELAARFDWSMRRIYDLNASSESHGILLASKGCVPEVSRTSVIAS